MTFVLYWETKGGWEGDRGRGDFIKHDMEQKKKKILLLFTFKEAHFFGTIFEPHLKLMTAVLQKLLQTSKHTNTSPPRQIKRVDDSAVERRSLGPAPCSSCCVHTYTPARLHAERHPPEALANYYHHRHSEGLPTA